MVPWCSAFATVCCRTRTTLRTLFRRCFSCWQTERDQFAGKTRSQAGCSGWPNASPHEREAERHAAERLIKPLLHRHPIVMSYPNTDRNGKPFMKSSIDYPSVSKGRLFSATSKV